MMKKFLILFLALSFTSSFGQAVNIRLSGVLQDSSVKNEIFRSNFLLPPDRSIEIFTGPYTVKFSAQKMAQGGYDLTAEFFGLGPGYHNASYDLKIPIGDSLPILPLTVKDAEYVKYMVVLLDDTSKQSTDEPPVSDTTAWGQSLTIHYQTYWLRGSYADFLWNIRMGYLEDIYDRYRTSFKLSEFDKIDYYFHPTPHTAAYLNPKSNYAIQPRARRIDLVFGPDIDMATPRPAIELLLYRMWGYGPRWMVTGFAGYYDDNILQMRALWHDYKALGLATRFADESWVDSDTGRIVTGAFARWLGDKEIFSKFMELYRQSTSINFQSKFEEIYGRSFENAATEFLEYCRTYVPKESELEYYASEYMGRGNFEQARDYFNEACNLPGKDTKPLNQLVLSEFWLGDYDSASRRIGPNPLAPNCDSDILRMNLQVANGVLNPLDAFSSLTNKIHCPQAIEIQSMCYLDLGQTEKASKALAQITNKDNIAPDYFIALGRLKVMQGQSADSILAAGAALAMGLAQNQPQEPVNYLLAGQAFLYMKRYDRAKENFDISLFLEKRPYFRGMTLLELGRLADLQEQRDKAKDYYKEVLDIKSGVYQKSLAKKYLKKKFEL